MAEPLPAALKIPEVSRFVNRANQLRSIKPAIAYWCEYHAVNQIVGKSLHTTDDDAFAYTKTLIERLEATKTEYATDESIVDNDVAKAYVEQFADQTFTRAERTMRANKVTRQTADTFDASATFFDLLREWGELDPEVLQKIKFAKWNAARILKAIREGKDPNESNPNLEQESVTGDDGSGAALDPNDPEVQEITSPAGPGPQAASLEEVADTGEPPAGASDDYFPAAPPSQAPPSSTNPAEPSPAISPVGPPSSSSQIPLQPSPQIPTKIPSQFTPPMASPPPDPTAPSPPSPDISLPQNPTFTPAAPAQAPAPITNPVSSTPSAAPSTDSPPLSRKDINGAQKHARWAISALDFDDLPTAVTELRKALAALGAQ